MSDQVQERGHTACLVLLATLFDLALLTHGSVVRVPGIEVDLGLVDLLIVHSLIERTSRVEIMVRLSRDGSRRNERDKGREQIEPHGE